MTKTKTYYEGEMKNVFFYYGEIGQLQHNEIVKNAFEKMMFEKMKSERY